MDLFYTVLPSNSPFQGNTTSDYLVKLPNIIDLSDGNWSVALSSIVYPQSFSGANEEQKIEIFYENKTVHNITVPSVNFFSITDLETKINKAVEINAKMSETVDSNKELDTAQLSAISLFKESETVFNSIVKLKEELKEKINLSINKDNKHILKNYLKMLDELHKHATTSMTALRRHITQSNQDYRNSNLTEIFTSIGHIKKEILNLNGIDDHLDRLKKQINEKISETITEVISKKSVVKKRSLLLEEMPYENFIDKWNIINVKDDTNEIYDFKKKKIVDWINENIKNNQPIYFYYDYESYEKFFLWANENVEKIRLSTQLAYLLGFTIDNQGFTCVNSFAKYTADITGGLHSFYVYAPNLIENTIIGNQYGPLLRVVNINQKSEKTIVESIYTQEFHYKVLPKQLNEIRIQIFSDTGKPIAFNWGNCIVTLHFKRSLF